MTQTITTKPSRVRRLPAYVLGVKLRRRGIMQQDIAVALGLSQTFISSVITRRAGRTRNAERVWQYIESVLIGDGRAA